MMRRQSKWIYKKRKCIISVHFLSFVFCAPHARLRHEMRAVIDG